MLKNTPTPNQPTIKRTQKNFSQQQTHLKMLLKHSSDWLLESIAKAAVTPKKENNPVRPQR